MKNPCIDCERKGCGSYHDECRQYKEWKEFERVRRGVGKRKPTGRFYLGESLFRSRVKKRCAK